LEDTETANRLDLWAWVGDTIAGAVKRGDSYDVCIFTVREGLRKRFPVPSRTAGRVSVSPDQTRILLDARSKGSGDRDVSVMDLATGVETTIAGSSGDEMAAAWTDSGKDVLFASNVDGSLNLYRANVRTPAKPISTTLVTALGGPGATVEYPVLH
jgi:Tol biopolymer transport system component